MNHAFRTQKLENKIVHTLTPDHAQKKKTFFLIHARVKRAITHGKRTIQNDWLIDNDVVITVIFLIHERYTNDHLRT